jgi:ATP/maltotriose-dependent transcriptional regulator MalT
MAYALAVLARLEAATGSADACRAHLDASERLAAMSESSALDVWNAHGRGLLELSEGRHDAVVEVLEKAAELWRREGVRCSEAVRWRQDIIESYVRLGRLREARLHLRELAEEATLTGTAATHALVARCRGLMADDHPRHFEEALARHAELDIPFDTARTHLAYGERLRRDRRRTHAREQLGLALEGFEALGARPWAERARGELAAAGVTTAPVSSPLTGRLTPRELQVSLAVARGATNREAASALFLSERTVERHLSATYAKLGVRSRSELTRLLTRAEDPPAGG